MSSSEKSVEVLAHSKRIFLYIHLKAIENLPSPNGVLELHLSHAKNNLTKLVDTYPSENIIDLSMFNEYKPTFSLMIEQDNIEDANIISDHPLLITLYDRIMVLVPSEEEMQEGEEHFGVYEEQLIPIAQGHIDLLRLCTKKRELITFHCILYPLSMSQSSFSSCTTMWEIYALMPLLKDLSICNVAYISFESIFNVRPNLSDVADLLVADIYFESKVPNEHNQYEKVKLCTFDKFCQQQLPENGLQLTWASLKREKPKNFDCLGIICGNYINIFNIFRKLVRTEGSKINFEKVNLDHSVITSNSTHRYVLSEQFVRVLEDVIAFDEQQLLIELYLVDQPHQLIAQGRFDLSILLYPYVNSKRFAVELFPVDAQTAKIKPVKPLVSRTSSMNGPDGPTFAIICICLLTPLTESSVVNSMEMPISKRNKSISTFNRTLKSRTEAYHFFEKQIKELIFYIIENDIKQLDDAKNILYCQKENLSNKIFKLISLDFNIRTPTRDSIEFHNLMTTIYSHAVQCTYDILQKFGNKVPSYIFIRNDNDCRIISYLSTSKYFANLGQDRLAKIFVDKAEKLSTGNTVIVFFKLIIDVENHDFKNAKQYYLREKNEQYEIAITYTELMRIYIRYVENLAHENTCNKAMEYLIVDLRDTVVGFPKVISFWVLLHSIFKYCGYLPGISYTRWRYEQLSLKIEIEMPLLPNSRFEITNPYELKFPNSQKKTLFLNVFKMLTNLGLYKFAELVFKELEEDCSALERYLTHTTLKILANEVPAKYPSKSFPANKGKGQNEQSTDKAFLMTINGHLEYSREDLATAMQNYENILTMNNEISLELYSLALLRYGYHMLENGQYNNAIEAFQKCEGGDAKIVANFGLGKAFFKLNRLEDAEQAFASCTTCRVHMPDVWGYLALVNLLQHRNFKALQFWKYAKIHPNAEFSEDLKKELEKVDINTITLYVDKPSIVL